jgi:hypothetical protein
VDAGAAEDGSGSMRERRGEASLSRERSGGLIGRRERGRTLSRSLSLSLSLSRASMKDLLGSNSQKSIHI